MDNKKRIGNQLRLIRGANWRHIGILVLLLCIIGILGFKFFSYFHNYAEDAAKPLELELLNAGAIKKCATSDPGRGPDNSVPSYEGRYQLNDTPEAAVKLIDKVAADNGYKLTYKQSPYSYIGWYADEIGKKVSYPGFENENVKVSFIIYGNGSTLACGQNGSAIRIDSTHTGIDMGVGLPSTVK